MDADHKKTALRMIPYGLYVLTAQDKNGTRTAATVNWVTQASFEPPLVVVGVKADSHPKTVIGAAGSFALNFLGKGQEGIAYAFFKSVDSDDQQIGGQAYRPGTTGSPILQAAPAYVECRVVETIEKGDHAVVIGEVVEAGVTQQPQERPDDAILWLKELGPRVFYGG
jgi:flavin reductase (DIM6/NTAB) family NADH-FMN oxidoreductase RutF